MGKGIVLRETTALLYSFTCVFMPMIGYRYYTINNELAALWVRYMPISEKDYMSFALPAIGCFCLAITWPLARKNSPDERAALEGFIDRIRRGINRKVGITIMIIGLSISLAIPYLPGGLQFFASLFFFGSFAGLLFLYYSPSFGYKKWIMTAFALFIFSNAINSGMFTIVAYMSVTIFSFFLLKSRASLFKKLGIVAIAFIFVIVLQNAKLAYRKSTWWSNYQGNRTELFANLFFENLKKGDALFETDAFYPVYARTNQGYNVALVMKRIPAIQQFDHGENLLKVAASSVVPRFLWPDKPEAGGRFNMEFYAGYQIRGFSTNIGPLGEAYGNFGVTGGIVYMFFLGLFIRWVYGRVFVLAKRNPFVICWLPVLFFQTVYSAEADTLQILNSLIKAAFFLWLLKKIFPTWFGIFKSRTVIRRRQMVESPA